MNILKKNWLIFLIILIGGIIRFYNFTDIPSSLNPDEAALGYNAYSILKTGADEHGKFLPLSLQSFGDWKLPGYSYVDILPIAIFGLNEFSVRLPSVISGVVGIVLIYFISQKIFKNKNVAYFVALFFAISSWSIYFSRIAYEVNLANTFFLSAFLSTLIAFERKKSALFILSSILFGFTIFTYHSYIIISPIFFGGILLLNYKKVIRNKFAYLSIVIFAVFVTSAYFSLKEGGVNKFNTTTIFNNKNVLYERVEIFRDSNQDIPELQQKIVHNKFWGVGYQIAQNYLKSFSPTFLFDKGGEKLLHNLYGFGNLYLVDSIFLIVGFAGIFWNKERFSTLLLWFIITPIPSALTLDAPNTTRLFPLMPILVLISGYGAYLLYSLAKEKKGLYAFSGLIVGFGLLLNVIFFIDLYFFHFNYQRSRFWHFGYKDLVMISNSKKFENYPVVMIGPENFPYIYFLFYNMYDPIKFRNQVKYYPPNSEGFYYVKSFGRYKFLNSLNGNDKNKNTLFIDNNNFNNDHQLIRLPNGDPIFRYYIVKE